LNTVTATFFGLGSQTSAGGVLSSNWVALGGGSVALQTLTGDSGGAVSPTLGNINILGNNQATFVGTPGSSTLTLTQTASGFPITRFVVGPVGFAGYQTIQAAVTAAGTAPAMIYVQPGTYTENITFTAAGNVTIASLSPDSVTITGVHVPPASGVATFFGVKLTSATHIFSSAVAGTATLTINECQIVITNGYIFNVLNWTGSLFVFNSTNVLSTNDGFLNNTGGANVAVTNSDVGAGTGNAAVMTGVTIEFIGSSLGCPATIGGAGTANFVEGCEILHTFTTAGSSVTTIYNSLLSTGATAAVSHGSSGTMLISNSTVTSSNNPAIAGAGAGALTLGGVDFTSNTATAGTLTISGADVFKAGSFQAITASNTAGASPQIVNSRAGQVKFTDTIANGAYGTLTMTNSSVVAGSIINANASCVTVNSAVTIVEITPTGGSVAFRIFNGGAASTAANILVNFNILN